MLSTPDLSGIFNNKNHLKFKNEISWFLDCKQMLPMTDEFKYYSKLQELQSLRDPIKQVGVPFRVW